MFGLIKYECSVQLKKGNNDIIFYFYFLLRLKTSWADNKSPC